MPHTASRSPRQTRLRRSGHTSTPCGLGRPAVLLRSDPARPADRRDRRRRPRPTRPGAAWRTSPRSARRRARRSATPSADDLPDRHVGVRVRQRGVRVVLRVRARRRVSRSGSRRCRGARRSRWTRWWRSLARRVGNARSADRRRHPACRRGSGRSGPRDAGPELADAERADRREVALKAENLQRTGSFKLRGALAKIAALGDSSAPHGVVAGSAGNHAQAVAYAARARGVPLRRVHARDGADRQGRGGRRRSAPRCASSGRRSTTRSQPPDRRADEGGLAFVHPFDDPSVIAGQGGVRARAARPGARPGAGDRAGRRRRTRQRDRDRGQVAAARGRGDRRPGRHVRARSRRRCRPASRSPVDSALTIADGIAVKRPGELTLALIEPLGRRGSCWSTRTRSPRRWCSCSSGRSWSSRAPARSASRRCSPDDVDGVAPGRRRSCCRAATSTPGCCWRVARRHESQAGRRLRAAGAAARPSRVAGAAAGARRPPGRQPARRRAHPRGVRPARARDRGSAGARDARAWPRRAS